MQKLRRIKLLQLINIFVFVLCGCSNPNRRIELDRSETLNEIINLAPVKDVSYLYYSTHEENSFLKISYCNLEKEGNYVVSRSGKTYANFEKSNSIFAEHNGNTKEGFLRKCITLDSAKSSFSYNDLLPILQRSATKASYFYNYSDLPSNSYWFDLDKSNELYDSFLSFMKKRLSTREYGYFSNSDSINCNFNNASEESPSIYLTIIKNSEKTGVSI